jgi:hypothetical protein
MVFIICAASEAKHQSVINRTGFFLFTTKFQKAEIMISHKPVETITDFVTGKPIPNTGAEENRQAVERFLVDEKEFDKQDITVNAPIAFEIDKESYESAIDLVVCVNGVAVMAVKCAAGALGSREREILAAARLYGTYQIPISVVSDGKTAVVLDTASGTLTGEGMTAIPSKTELTALVSTISFTSVRPDRQEREKLIFRSYDSMNVNRIRQG